MATCKYCGASVYFMQRVNGSWTRPLVLLQVNAVDTVVLGPLGAIENPTIYIRHYCDPATSEEYQQDKDLITDLEEARGAAYSEEINRRDAEADALQKEWERTPQGWREIHLVAQTKSSKARRALEMACPTCHADPGEPCFSVSEAVVERIGRGGFGDPPAGCRPYLSKVHNLRY